MSLPKGKTDLYLVRGAGPFKKIHDVLPVLESLASLGFLLAFGLEDEPCWKALRA